MGARKAAMTDWVPPQLATLVEQMPTGTDWMHELKYDGYRILAAVREGHATLWTRNHNEWTAKLRQIAEAVEGLGVAEAWLDGEVVSVRPDGSISFQALQNAFDMGSDVNLVYYVFDILHLNGYDLRSAPLKERKQLLAPLLASDTSKRLRFSDHIEGHGDAVFSEACRRGMEGLVSKRADAPYTAGRTRSWVKVKCGQRQEFVIGGFTEPSGSRVAFGALLLGVYDGEGQFRYVGRTGTGFTQRSLKSLRRRLTPLEQTKSPFVNPPKGAEARDVHWVKPVVVAEVAFAQWTSDGILRQASFQGLRDDKPATDICKEQSQPETDPEAERLSATRRRRWAGVRASRRKDVSTQLREATQSSGIAGVSLTHPDRVLFPEQRLTKLALAQYYERVADWIIPHLEHRPLTLVRCPEGYRAECFYQKHATETMPDAIERVNIQEDKTMSIYMVADSLPAIVGLVQMGVLELHTWGARQYRLDRPDRIIMDLDPDPTVPWKSVIEAAQLLRTLFNELGLACFLKTTGGKGLHVAVPIQRVHTWDEVKSFAKAIAEHLVTLIPERFVANMSKQKRKGKIYVDFLRNARGATAIAAYSTRAKPFAPVSVPLAWDELSIDLRSDHFNVANVPQRLAHLHRDPWHEYFVVKQKLTKKMKEAIGGLRA